MVNPAKPVEMKRQLGNLGRRPLPDAASMIPLEAGRVEPSVELGPSGMRLWDSVFEHGGLWVSGRTDVHLLTLVCQQLDRRDVLMESFDLDPTDRKIVMSLNETEKLIASNLGLLGFTPSDRARLGLAEVRAKSKLEELAERRDARG